VALSGMTANAIVVPATVPRMRPTTTAIVGRLDQRKRRPAAPNLTPSARWADINGFRRSRSDFAVTMAKALSAAANRVIS